MRGPGLAPGVADAFVSQVDLMPTTLDIAGLDPDAGRALDGRSLLDPLRTGDWGGWRQRLLVENPNLGWAMVREGTTAYVDHHDRDEWELYDLATDPHQLASLAGTDPADVAAWAAKADGLRAATGTALRALEE